METATVCSCFKDCPNTIRAKKTAIIGQELAIGDPLKINTSLIGSSLSLDPAENLQFTRKDPTFSAIKQREEDKATLLFQQLFGNVQNPDF